MGNANLQTGPFPHRVRPCAAMNSPSHSGHGSRPSCRTVLITARQATRLTIPVRSSTASSGSSIPAPRGVTSPNATAPGRRSSTASTGGAQDGTWVRIVTSLLDELDDKRPDRPRPLVYRRLRHPGQSGGGRGEKKSRSRRAVGRAVRRRKCKSRLTMRWGVRGADSARRSIWSVTAMVSSSPSTSRPAKRMRARRSSRRWPGGCFTAAAASAVGRGDWRGTRVTAIRASGGGVGGGGSKR